MREAIWMTEERTVTGFSFRIPPDRTDTLVGVEHWRSRSGASSAAGIPLPGNVRSPTMGIQQYMHFLEDLRIASGRSIDVG